MRITVNLDDDLYAIAKGEAHLRDVSISAAVNLLLRRALEPGIEPIPAAMVTDASGWPVVRGKKVVTSEDVKALDDEP